MQTWHRMAGKLGTGMDTSLCSLTEQIFLNGKKKKIKTKQNNTTQNKKKSCAQNWELDRDCFFLRF